MDSTHQGSYQNSPDAELEMDFNDVFGGPPRRFSNQEVRKTGSWSEKPVFGEERRRYQGDEFYGDIFRGDESYSSPRRTDRDPYGSTPGSRVLSPAKAEPFGTSLPAQFSLPAKLTKATEYPAFGSGNHSPYYNKDGALNGSSRFSSQTRQQENDSQDVNQFHFSIYKWAGKGVPLLIPLMRGKNLKSKENSRLETCLSSNARVQCDQEDDKFKIFIDTKPETWKIGSENQENQNNNDYMEPDIVAVEATINISEPKNLNNTKNEVLRKKETDSKSLPALLNDDHQRQGNGEINQAGREKKVTINDVLADDSKINENMKKSDVKVDKNLMKKREVDVNKNAKKNDVEAKINGKKSGSKGITKNMPSDSGEKLTKVGMKGKVQEFVKIFNQETTSLSKGESRSQSSRWKGSNINIVEKETASTTRQTNEELKLPSMNKTTDASHRVDQNLNMKEKMNKHSRMKRPSIHQPSSNSTDKSSASSYSEPIQNDMKGSIGSADDLFHGSFEVEELFNDQTNPSQKNGDYDDTKALDAKIQQWSQGRKGNIRSLLSTLQLALWAESGWKNVPLVDLIEGSAVKRAYQKALLCLHPDKLQQKGAASHQKYIAEKVFDILQEAWDHFNSVGGI